MEGLRGPEPVRRVRIAGSGVTCDSCPGFRLANQLLRFLVQELSPCDPASDEDFGCTENTQISYPEQPFMALFRRD